MPPVASTLTRLFSNAAWQATGEAASRVGAMVLAVVLARWLGAEGFGVFGTVFAITGYCGLMVAAGSDVLGMRVLAQDPQRAPEMTGRVVATRLLMATIAVAALAVAVATLPERLLPDRFALLIGSFGILALALNLTWALRALERGRAVALGAVLEQLVCAIAVIVLWRGQLLDVRAAVAAQVIAQWIVVLWCYRAVTAAIGRIEWRVPMASALTLSRTAMELLAARFPRMLFYSGDILLAAWLLSAAAAGEFLAAQRVVLALVGFSTLVMVSTFPLLCRLADADRPAFVVFQCQILGLLLLVLIPVTVVGAAFAEELVALLFGAPFASAAPVLRILFAVLPVFVASIVIQDALFAAQRTRVVVKVGCVAMAVHLALAVLLAPHLGVVGIGLACLAGEATSLAMLVAIAARDAAWTGASRSEARKCVLTLACGAAMAAALWLSMRFGVLASTCVAIAMYLAMTRWLKVLSPSELAMLLRAVRGQVAPEQLSAAKAGTGAP